MGYRLIKTLASIFPYTLQLIFFHILRSFSVYFQYFIHFYINFQYFMLLYMMWSKTNHHLIPSNSVYMIKPWLCRPWLSMCTCILILFSNVVIKAWKNPTLSYMVTGWKPKEVANNDSCYQVLRTVFSSIILPNKIYLLCYDM